MSCVLLKNTGKRVMRLVLGISTAPPMSPISASCNHQSAAPVQNTLPPLPPNCVQLAVILKLNLEVTITACESQKQLKLVEFQIFWSFWTFLF